MKLKHILLTAALVALPFAPIALHSAHATSSTTTANLTDNLTSVKTTAGFGGTDSSLPSTIGSLVNVLLGLLGVIFLLLVLYAGLIWMTAGGNPDSTKKAKQILFNSIIGLVILLSAYAISSFVISQLSTATGTG